MADRCGGLGGREIEVLLDNAAPKCIVNNSTKFGIKEFDGR